MKRDENRKAATWSTPYVWENELRTELVTSASGKVRVYDLEGKQLWEIGGMTILTAPSPFSKHGLVYVSSGYPGDSPRPVYAIRPGATGDIRLKPGETGNQYVAWFQPTLGTYQTSALVYGDYYYTLLDRGFLLCHDARTGKQIYGRQRISPEASGFTSSPWAYNGKIFLLSEDGDTFVERQLRPQCRRAGRVGHLQIYEHFRTGGASKIEHLQHAGRACRARDAAKFAGLRGRPRGWAGDCGCFSARVTSRCQHLQNADAARDVAVGDGIILVAVGRGSGSEVPLSEGHIIVLREK